MGEIFDVGRIKLVNVSNITEDTEAVNIRQLNNVKRYINCTELYTLFI